MLDEEQKKAISALVEDRLDEAEYIWKECGPRLIVKKGMAMDEAINARADSVPSKIPGHEIVSDRKIEVDEFVALVADMRESSKHLIQAIGKPAKVSMLERVFYETSALLPALGLTIQFEEGRVTEYLGDGALAMFRVSKDNKGEAVKAAYRAARNCVEDTRKIVNAALSKRYSLPEINLGVGLAWSKAVVTLVGLDGDKHPKVFGECVYRASKLAGGQNEILVDEYAHSMWPTSNGGKLSFKRQNFGAVDGYIVHRNNE